MLTELKIENFKCFRQLEIKPLARVNLFVGLSNTGKTAVLEAIDMLPQRDGFHWSRFRDNSLQNGACSEFTRWLFTDLNEDALVCIKAQMSDGPRIAVIDHESATKPNLAEIVHKMPPNQVWWHPSRQGWISRIAAVTTERLSAAALAKNYDRWTLKPENDGRFVRFLREVDDRLQSVRAMEPTGTRMLYADVRLKERIALPLLGEGFNRLVQILGAIIGEKAEIVLIDEIENGLHWSALHHIWKGLRAALAENDVQIFATTHNMDCIAAAVEAFKGGADNELAVHRLERRGDGQIHCVTIGEEELGRMLERGWEVR